MSTKEEGLIVKNLKNLITMRTKISQKKNKKRKQENKELQTVAQVLSNLVSNAIKFTSKGEIDISLEKSQDGKGVVASVKDTGSGIDSDIMPRLFTKFATRSDSGTGLGLYISKNIVEAQGEKYGLKIMLMVMVQPFTFRCH